MGYIENNLSKDEKIMGRIKHSWAGMVSEVVRFLILLALAILMFSVKNIIEKLVGVNLGNGVEGLFLTILCDVFGAFILFLAVYIFLLQFFEMKSAQLVVTDKRIFGRRGFISKYTTDIMLSKVDTINVSNGFFGAIFHYGT
ncbi:MAG: PH domain-containing protein, partial [Clostridia bacterium]|nr:PH domain-containing protein [Clostridia bacterium]